MSRIGNKVISLPENVSVDVNAENVVTVKGPKGTLTRQFPKTISLKIENNDITVIRSDDKKANKQLHGTFRAHLNNMANGVSKGFEKKLLIVGVGYRAMKKGDGLTLNLGYSHPVEVIAREGIKIDLPKNTEIILSGIDLERVTSFAADIKAFRKPDAYKGKGIRYADEIIRTKEGKKSA